MHCQSRENKLSGYFKMKACKGGWEKELKLFKINCEFHFQNHYEIVIIIKQAITFSDNFFFSFLSLMDFVLVELKR